MIICRGAHALDHDAFRLSQPSWIGLWQLELPNGVKSSTLPNAQSAIAMQKAAGRTRRALRSATSRRCFGGDQRHHAVARRPKRLGRRVRIAGSQLPVSGDLADHPDITGIVFRRCRWHRPCAR